MDNYKKREFIDPSRGFLYVVLAETEVKENMLGHEKWIEIPEGTEIIRMNCEGSLNFYKKIDGHWAIKNKVDMENWYQPKPYSSHFDADDGSLPIIWQRPTQDQGLLSGAEALRALADRRDVQVSTEFTRSSWHDDTATYSVEEILAEETAETDDYNSMRLFFRLKPDTLTVNTELPKPSNTTLHNQNYSVTYEFKTREDRNAFVEGLGGNNS